MSYNRAVRRILKRSVTISVCLDLTVRNQCAEETLQLCVTEYSFITYAVSKSYNQQIENNILTLTEDSSLTNE